MAEFDLIQGIRSQCPNTRADTVLGIGDDGAQILAEGALSLVTDTLVQGVHFFPHAAPADLGWKSLAVNLSDLAAMGASPAWALLNLTLPTAGQSFVQSFMSGFAELAHRYDVDLIGGDTTRGPLSITVTALGHAAAKPLQRGTAQVGDLIVVSGHLGDAAWAYRSLYQQCEPASYFLARLNRPEPRIGLGQILVGNATSAMDISDGLYADLHHLLGLSALPMSSPLGADIMLQNLPTSPALKQACPSCDERWEVQLSGGDDYELLFTVAPANAAMLAKWQEALQLPLSIIGEVTANSDIRCYRSNGEIFQPTMKGYEHFRENSR